MFTLAAILNVRPRRERPVVISVTVVRAHTEIINVWELLKSQVTQVHYLCHVHMVK